MMEGLPLFPLGLVLYPEEELPLHIFEPRYRDMVAYCLENDTPFGIVLFQDGEMADVGCTARIDRIVLAHEDGRKDILVTGVDRIRILNVNEDASYYTADVEILADEPKDPDSKLRERVIAQHIKLLELAGRMPAPTSYMDRKFLSFFIAHNAGLTVEQKQDILQLPGEADRLEYLAGHLEKFIPMVEEVEGIRMKVLSNGHFKDFPIDGDGSGREDEDQGGGAFG
jgi:ATP-dependent Lon protease